MGDDSATKSHESASAAVASAKADDLAKIHCIGCGYALRGLSTSGVCPECGLNVTASTVDHWLDEARAPTRRTMRRLLVWVTCGPLFIIAAWAFSAFVIPNLRGVEPSWIVEASRFAGFGLALIPSVRFVRSCWQITRRASAVEDDRSLIWRRWALRSAGLVFAASAAVLWTESFLPVLRVITALRVERWIVASTPLNMAATLCAISWQLQALERRFKRPVAHLVFYIALSLDLTGLLFGMFGLMAEVSGTIGGLGGRSDSAQVISLALSIASWIVLIVSMNRMLERLSDDRP